MIYLCVANDIDLSAEMKYNQYIDRYIQIISAAMDIRFLQNTEKHLEKHSEDIRINIRKI